MKDRSKNVARRDTPSNQGVGLVHASIQRSGPLPPAEEIAHYEAVLPGSAERIFGMAERQQTHMHTCDMSTLSIERENVGMKRMGLISGFLLGAGAIGTAYYMIWKEMEGVAYVLLAISIVITVALAGRFALSWKKLKIQGTKPGEQ